jgi:predicted nucleic acid-binding protein
MLVADASVVMEWFLSSSVSPVAARAFAKARRSFIVVPSLWLWETHNVLLTYQRRHLLGRDEVSNIRAELSVIPKRIDSPPDSWIIDRTWEIATAQMATFYDSSYVELALRFGLPLASTDRGLRHAATGMGVELI